MIDQVADEERQVILRQPVPQARRQQEILLGHVGAIVTDDYPDTLLDCAPDELGPLHIVGRATGLTRCSDSGRADCGGGPRCMAS